jgi:hypothetical protein
MIFPRLSGGFSQDFRNDFMIFPGFPNLSASTRPPLFIAQAPEF